MALLNALTPYLNARAASENQDGCAYQFFSHSTYDAMESSRGICRLQR
jgi:hypothetical protein